MQALGSWRMDQAGACQTTAVTPPPIVALNYSFSRGMLNPSVGLGLTPGGASYVDEDRQPTKTVPRTTGGRTTTPASRCNHIAIKLLVESRHAEPLGKPLPLRYCLVSGSSWGLLLY